MRIHVSFCELLYCVSTDPVLLQGACLGHITGCLGALPFCLCCADGNQIVEEGEVAVRLKFGKKDGEPLESGHHFINPRSETLRKFNKEGKVIDGLPLPFPAIILDGTYKIPAPLIAFRVTEPDKAVWHTKLEEEIQLQVQQELQRAIHGRSWSQINQIFMDDLTNQVNRSAGYLGVEITVIGFRDTITPFY